MKALHFREHGSIDNLAFGEIPTPSPNPDEVLVEVKAAALNRLDLWVLRGWPGLKLEMPHVGGSDIAGVIAEVGKDVKNFSTGERVVVNPGYSTLDDKWTESGEEVLSPGYRIIGEHVRGGFAEYVCVPQKNIHKIPAEFSFEEAAAPLLVGVTAWRMLKTRGGLQAGETVLIIGAGGGLNSFSIQLCKHFGARVIALTSSKEKEKRARALGADEVVNYVDRPDWHKVVYELTSKSGVELVVDNVGAKTIKQSILATAPGGRIVTVGNTSGHQLDIDNRYLFAKQISLIGSTMGNRDDFNKVLELIWARKLKPVIDSVLPLGDGKQGYQRLENSEQFGKVILTP